MICGFCPRDLATESLGYKQTNIYNRWKVLMEGIDPLGQALESGSQQIRAWHEIASLLDKKLIVRTCIQTACKQCEHQTEYILTEYSPMT